MGVFSTVVALLFGLLILFFELIRTKKIKPIDILTGINLVYLVCFSIVPFFVYFSDGFIVEWALKNDKSEIYYVGAILLAFLSYLIVVSSYIFFNKIKFNLISPKQNNLLAKDIYYLTLLFGLIGFIAFIIFTSSIGGFMSLFETNTLYRSGNIEVSGFAFMRNIALFIPLCSFFFYILKKEKGNKNTILLNFLFFTSFILSIILYFNRAGRLSLIEYLFSFLLIKAMIDNKSLFKYSLAFLPFFTFFVLYGKNIYNFFMVENWTLARGNGGILDLFKEFSFPFFSATNALKYSFFDEEPRLFMDFIIGVLNLLPSGFIPINIPEEVTQLNTASFGGGSGIPVDIVSLGYYSFGIAGVIIISIFLGCGVSVVERLILNNLNNYWYVFYIQFILFFSFRVAYAGPTNTLKSNFSLLVFFATAVIILIFKNSNRKSKNI